MAMFQNAQGAILAAHSLTKCLNRARAIFYFAYFSLIFFAPFYTMSKMKWQSGQDAKIVKSLKTLFKKFFKTEMVQLSFSFYFLVMLRHFCKNDKIKTETETGFSFFVKNCTSLCYSFFCQKLKISKNC